MKTKKGMASLYLVAFTTLLLGIVTMSFARVMISESREASNSDLSQSAFDSALAGIEDAKTAILMYEKCQNGSTDSNCESILSKMNAAFDNHNCDVVRQIINNNNGTGEVVISDPLDQAYTCVPIANDSPTYRSILNEDTRSRVVPAKFKDDGHKNVVGIELQWYSPSSNTDVEEGVAFMNNNLNDNFIPFGTKDAALNTAPVLAFELFQTDAGFTMAELDLNNNGNNGTDHTMIMLYPYEGVANDDKGTFISARNLLDASSKSSQTALKSGEENSIVPKLVTCGYYSDNYEAYDGGAHCRATIEFPATYQDDRESYQNRSKDRAKSTFMFRVSLPYGTPQTDFSIAACTKIENGKCTDRIDFVGAQYIIDSTGRASTLYRRIIARVETTPAPIFPEYAVQVYGNNSTIEKDFWVTENCWLTDGKGNSANCSNNGDASSSFPQ